VQLWQHALAVEINGSPGVGLRSVDKRRDTGVEQLLHRRDMRGGIGPHDPRGGNLSQRYLLSNLLDRYRVGLRQQLRRGRGGQKPPALGCVIDLGAIADDDEALQEDRHVRGVFSGGAGAVFERSPQPWIDAAPGGDPSVTVLAGEAGAFGATRGDVNRRWLFGQVIQLQLLGLEVATAKRDSLAAPQLADQRNRLDEPVMPLGIATELPRTGQFV
jgi:hypothetical protein